MRGLLLLLVFGCASDPRVVVQTPDGTERVRYHVEVARTAAERMQGLRGADSLADDEGLWIEFPVTDELCILNTGVPFAIDAIFVRSGRVVAVETLDAEASDARCHDASEVLEVNANSPIQIGDTASLD